ncbi:hypothetical protein BLA34_22000 [Ralstonia solanacearum]|nr:hypothetical protein BLA34_22000 [Ralstonia solanacearum]
MERFFLLLIYPKMFGTLSSVDCSLEPVWHIALTIPALAVSATILRYPLRLLLASLATPNVEATCCDEIGQCQSVLGHLLAHPKHCFSLRAQAFDRICVHERTI